MGDDEKKSGTDEKKPLVLVVEDDTFLSSVHKNKLAKEGFEVVITGNGREALQFAKERRPDIILLDLIMPVMDGFETLKALKADPALREVTVIILSNLSQEEDKQKFLDMGAVEYVVKANVSFSQVVEKVRQYLR
jgi:CheY-like chemotaxis protein